MIFIKWVKQLPINLILKCFHFLWIDFVLLNMETSKIKYYLDVTML